MRLLLVEDEIELAAALAEALARHGVVMDHVASLEDARGALSDAGYDAILLDRQLPDGEGLTIIPDLRAAGVNTPIIVLTARNDRDERIRGLDRGADDYLGKPFSVDELMARLRAVLRRGSPLKADVVIAGGLSFDLSYLDVSIAGKRLELPRRELLLLASLVKRSGRTVPREALVQAIFSFDAEVQPNTLDVHVSRLRRKLAEAGAGVTIQTIRGIGYMLEPRATAQKR
ncbi:MAG TPA: response regulator transcription factor [Dongiaceae bacterium]|nr:response regulator transcription factor [Dongiaceae bacterium]